MYRDMEIKRGMVFYVDLGSNNGSIQSGRRPAIVTSNNVANKFSPVITVAPITSKVHKKRLPTQILLNCEFLSQESMAMTEQLVPVNKSQLLQYEGMVDDETIKELDNAIVISQGVNANNITINNIVPREIKVVNEKVESIRGLDSFIQLWLEKDRDITLIEEDIRDREIKLKDLEWYCNRFGMNYKEFYTPRTIVSNNNRNNIRMVG